MKPQFPCATVQKTWMDDEILERKIPEAFFVEISGGATKRCEKEKEAAGKKERLGV